MKLRWRAAAIVAVASALALTGCSTSSLADGASTAAKKSGGTLTLGVIALPPTFAADGMAWADSAPFAQAVYDTLLHAAPNGNIEPWLAKSWKYNSTDTVLTMKLRSGVTFTDGSKFNAGVAAQNLLRFRDGTSANKSALADVTGATALSADTLQITLSTPDPALVWFLTQAPGLEESAKAFTSPTVATVPVGSGPYVLDTKDTVVGSTYVFTKNPHYWAPSSVHYRKLVLKYYTSSNAILDAIEGGQVNATTTLDNNSLNQIKAAGFRLNPNELNWEGLDLFDRNGTLNPALKNVLVRQAINYAFDRKGLLQAIGSGYGTVTTQIFSPASPAYVPSLNSAYPYDPAKAKKLLAEAGYPHGFTLNIPAAAGTPATVYAILQQQLGAVGITLTLTNVGANQLADVAAGKFAAADMTLSAQPNVSVMWALDLTTTASWNPFHYQDATMNGYYKTITTGSPAAAALAAKKLNEYIVKEALVAPWFRPELNYATDAHTTVTVQRGNSYPYLWNFKPKA